MHLFVTAIDYISMLNLISWRTRKIMFQYYIYIYIALHDFVFIVVYIVAAVIDLHLVCLLHACILLLLFVVTTLEPFEE